jgi:hypothetical protein
MSKREGYRWSPVSKPTEQELKAKLAADLKAKAIKEEYQKQKAAEAKAAAELTLPASEGAKAVLDGIAGRQALAAGIIGAGVSVVGSGLEALAVEGAADPLVEVGVSGGAGSGFDPRSSGLPIKSWTVHAYSPVKDGALTDAAKVLAGGVLGGAVAGPVGAVAGAVLAGSVKPAEARKYRDAYDGYDDYLHNLLKKMKTRDGAKKMTKEEAYQRDDDFDGTALHGMLANGWFEAADALLDKSFKELEEFKENGVELKHQLDKHGRSPLFLALMLKAPNELLLKLIDEKSVKMTDKYQFSNLGIAAMTADPVIFEAMLKRMSPEDRDRYLGEIDRNGKSFAQKYLEVSDENFEKFCLKFSTNPNRAANTDHDDLFYNSPDNFERFAFGMAHGMTKEEIDRMSEESGFGLQMAKVTSGGQPLIGILATAENLQTMRNIATSDTTRFTMIRGALEDGFGVRASNRREFWESVKAELAKIELSSKTVHQLMKERREANMEIFARYAPPIAVLPAPSKRPPHPPTASVEPPALSKGRTTPSSKPASREETAAVPKSEPSTAPQKPTGAKQEKPKALGSEL